MHVNFVKLKETVEREQDRAIDMQQKMFKMMKEMQTFAIEEATRSSRVLGKVSQQCVDFHNRCIPKYKQKSYEIGLSAVNHRHKRDRLQQESQLSRQKAEHILREERLADLDVWEDCLPLNEVIKNVSSRDCRVKTRQITKQLQEANQESKGAEFPLKVVDKVCDKKRDATAEVGR